MYTMPSCSRLLHIFVPLVVFITVLICFSPVDSTSRGALQHGSPSKHEAVGFKVTLRHIDAGKNLTKFERLRHRMKRSHHRLQRLNAMVLASSSSDVEAPVIAGNGEFLMDLSIGTPPTKYAAILDTGSDLIWTQCKPCVECFDQPTPIFDPKKSSTFSKVSCSSSLCAALPQSNCGSDGCEYLYTYGDYSSTQGVMASETFTFGKVSLQSVGFGCGEDNEGDGFSQGAGLVGLGRGPLSLVSQLKEPKFSYCLTTMDDTKTSTLLMGSLARLSNDSTAKTTPLIRNPLQPSFYYLNLQGISVGSKRLPISRSTFELQDDGTGGMIIDSGTTITYLEQSAFDKVRKAFTEQMKLSVDKSGSTGLDLCFDVPNGTSEVKVPKLVLHFEDANLELPSENYFISDADMGVLCLAMGASSGLSILGNIQQQNMLVLHDLKQETLTFVHTHCDQL